MNYHHKTVVITGAAKGIGASCAKVFLDAGANVALLDIDFIIPITDANSLSIVCDVSDEVQVKTAMEKIQSHFGSIDYLVNNAGIIRDKRLLNMTEADWDDVINVNLKSQFLFCQATIKEMLPRNFGRIVNISSRAWLGGFGQSNYSAAKGGVISLTRSLAIEFAAKGITVNAIAPGIIQTPLFDSFDASLQSKLKESVPVKRIGTPDDVAYAVMTFLNPDASYLTGQVLYVCGGRSLSSPSV